METQEDLSRIPDYPKGFTFSHEGKWLIKIDEKGIRFNREQFPNLSTDEFATEFLNLIENSFDVEFKKNIRKSDEL